MKHDVFDSLPVIQSRGMDWGDDVWCRESRTRRLDGCLVSPVRIDHDIDNVVVWWCSPDSDVIRAFGAPALAREKNARA